MIGGVHPRANVACRRGDGGRGPFVSVLPIRAFGPLLVGVERASGMRARTHLDVVVWWATRHRGQVVMAVRVVDWL